MKQRVLKRGMAWVLAGAVLAAAPACKMTRVVEGEAWRRDADALALAPKADWVQPAEVVRTEGRVERPEALLREDGASCSLRYDAGGVKPVAVLDFGKGSVGGYAVLTVTASCGQPVVRVSYANHPDGLAETGDFTRETSARYLGKTFDLPVLPGNINRHETYTIPRTGRFIAPLLQGQARYVRVQVDTPGASADIDAVAMVNSEVYDRAPQEGLFLCSDERINKLWAISAWTLQIASFPNHDAWKTVDGWLLPRKLEMSEEVGLSAAGEAWGDVTVETRFELRANPHHVSAAGVAFRAQDERNAYLAEVALDGSFRLLRRRAGKDVTLAERKLAGPLTDGVRYGLVIEARGPELRVTLDGALLGEARDDAFASGRVGFYTPKEKWPLFDFIRVKDGAGKALLADDFNGPLTQWRFARTLSYVADGAKRDRLVWSGDLYFAQRSAYYAFARPTYLRDSLKMLAFNQTPEGYVHAAPYPERSDPPAAGECGPFPSDEFAAWLVPVAWDHLLYTDDVETLRGVWPALRRLLEYLSLHIGTEGLFVQRLETSKHAGNLNLGDVRARSYMNVLLWGTFRDAARIADRLGLAEESAAAQRQADALKRVLYEKLWDERGGFFREALETPGFGPEANALALAMGLVTDEQARRVAPQFKRIGHGKFQSLASRGKFEYGFGQSALQTLFEHNWLKLLEPEWKGAWTTTECMGLMTKGWGDESHPDTAVAGHFSAYLLGVRPLSPGYATFSVRPQPTREVTWAKGLVPTPHGVVSVAWERAGERFTLALTVPAGARANVVLPPGGAVTVNGRSRACEELGPGRYTIEARGLPAGAWDDPTASGGSAEASRACGVKASSSHEAGGWSAAHVLAPEAEAGKMGYSSAPHATAEAQEWLELDLGAAATVEAVTLVAREGGAGFPRDFAVQVAKRPGEYATVAVRKGCSPPGPEGLAVDLYTVIGYPVGRYVRIAASRLGAPAADEPGVYRLQLKRVRVARP